MRGLLILLLALLLACPATAAPTPAPLQAQVDAGTKALQDGRYDEAIQLLQDAYDQLKDPVLLFNIGQAHRKAGHSPEAIDAFERYLAAQPDSPYRDKVEGYLSKLRQRSAPALAPPASAPAPAPIVSAALPPAPHVATTPPPRPLYKRAWFWGVLGGVVAAGVIAGAVGGTVGAHASHGYDVQEPPWSKIP